MRRKSVFVAACSLLPLVLFGRPGIALAFDPPTDPCSLFSAEQVSAATGLKAMPAKHVVATLCEWDLAGDGAGPASARKLTVGFLSASAWEQTRALRESMKATVRTPVEGLGEEAVFVSNPVTNTLQVKKGKAVLDMHLYGFNPEQAKAKQIALARLALARF